METHQSNAPMATARVPRPIADARVHPELAEAMELATGTVLQRT